MTGEKELVTDKSLKSLIFLDPQLSSQDKSNKIKSSKKEHRTVLQCLTTNLDIKT